MKQWFIVVGFVSIVIVVRERQRRRLLLHKDDKKKKQVVAPPDTNSIRLRSSSYAFSKRLRSLSYNDGGSIPPGKLSSPQYAPPLIGKEVFPPSDASLVDIGTVMGMDIGGSLAKLVYFEKFDFAKKNEGEATTPDNGNGENGHLHVPTSTENANSSSQEHTSCFDKNHSDGTSEFQSRASGGSNISSNLIHTVEQHIALENFYTFMDTAQIIGGRFSVHDEHLTVRCPEFGGLLHFFRFETRHMDRAISLVRSSRIADHLRSVGCSGGGAYKYEPFMTKTLNLRVQQNDEMDCIVRGLQFATENIEGEVYSYYCDLNKISPTCSPSTTDCEQDTFRNMRMRHMAGFIDHVDISERVYCGIDRLKASYPALVICIGSGVSILKVDGPSKFERVSGSSIGGGTFLGLCRLLTGANDFDMALDMASEGDSDAADMVVGDIYGRGYNKFQLSSNTLASSFGKVWMNDDPRSSLTDNDIAKSLVVMITMNIGQVAYMNAKLHDTSTIFFIGNFLRHNDISARQLSFAIDYWSGGCMEALFLEHEGYLCALGCLLKSWEESGEKDGHDSSPVTPPAEC